MRVKIKLAKNWGAHREGKVVECDTARAAALRAAGYEAHPAEGSTAEAPEAKPSWLAPRKRSKKSENSAGKREEQKNADGI